MHAPTCLVPPACPPPAAELHPPGWPAHAHHVEPPRPGLPQVGCVSAFSGCRERGPAGCYGLLGERGWGQLGVVGCRGKGASLVSRKVSNIGASATFSDPVCFFFHPTPTPRPPQAWATSSSRTWTSRWTTRPCTTPSPPSATSCPARQGRLEGPACRRQAGRQGLRAERRGLTLPALGITLSAMPSGSAVPCAHPAQKAPGAAPLLPSLAASDTPCSFSPAIALSCRWPRT